MSKSKDKIRVSFGHQAEDVTGSYTLIECGQSGKKILVDFGLIQENMTPLKEYQENSKRPKFKPKDLDYVFLTHAHIDHSQRINMLYKWGCTAPFIMVKGTTQIFKAMSIDSCNIMQKDAEYLSLKFKKDYPPLYTEDDIKTTLSYIQEYNEGEKIKLDDDITFQFNYTGHIFKACSITFWIKNGSQTRKIIVTGDAGNISVNQKFCEKFVPYESCNLLIGESTYSDPKRSTGQKQRDKDLEKLKAGIITTCIDNHGSVLIPVFAFGRTPTMLAHLYDIFYEDSQKGEFNVPIVYASPLGAKLLDIYKEELDDDFKEELEKVLAWKNLKILKNFDELEAEMKDLRPKVILAASGMMVGGYSSYVASKLLPGSKNNIIFCGYSVEGSLAYKIKQKKTKTVSIDGRPVPARCNVMNLTSFSSHMQYDDLMRVYSGDYGVYDKVVLVHGNYKSKLEFGKKLQEECEKKNKTTKVCVANKGTEICI